jgi:LemA protein
LPDKVDIIAVEVSKNSVRTEEHMHHILLAGVILAAIMLWIYSLQRSLAGMNENVNNAMAQIGIQISSQWKILMCLLDLAEWYADHECVIIIETMNERCPVTKNSLPDDVRKQETLIAETIRQITNAAEGHPELKADRNYGKTMDAIQQYQNMVETSKLIYNDSAAKLNLAIRRFPISIVARVLGFSNRGYFKTTESTNTCKQNNNKKNGEKKL